MWYYGRGIVERWALVLKVYVCFLFKQLSTLAVDFHKNNRIKGGTMKTQIRLY